MRKKKGGHAGGHGWFVTFADLMALLLSFFVMLVAFSTQDRQKLQLVAGSMRDAFGTTRDSYYAGIIEIMGIPVRPRLKNAVDGSPEDASAETAPSSKEASEQGRNLIARDQGVALAASSLRQAINEMPELAELSKNIIVEERVNGINVALTDQTGLSMFPEGSTGRRPRASRHTPSQHTQCHSNVEQLCRVLYVASEPASLDAFVQRPSSHTLPYTFKSAYIHGQAGAHTHPYSHTLSYPCRTPWHGRGSCRPQAAAQLWLSSV